LIIAVATVSVLSTAIVIMNPAYTTNTGNLNPNCMSQANVHIFAQFSVKEPVNLPSGYKFQCGSADNHEAHLLYGQQALTTPNNTGSFQESLNEQIANGAIYLHLVDEKDILGNERFATEVGNTTQRTVDVYHEIIRLNPSLQPKLVNINGITAWVNEACETCGKQTADFGNGKILQNSFAVPARVQFYDQNGILYTLQSNMPLQDLIKVAESLR